MNQFVESMANLPTPFNFVIGLVLIICASSVIGGLITEVRKFASHRAEIQLKRELVERGLDMDEIERVIAARGPLSTDDGKSKIGCC